MGSDIQFSADGGFETILAEGLVQPVFQPVVAFADEQPVGFEALARGPKGRFHGAAALFAAAARTGRSAELDWLCTNVAGRRYREADLSGLALFVNVNPDTLATDPPNDVAAAWADLTREEDVVLEITERSVMREPAGLLKAVVDARQRSVRIAIDDLGAEPASLVAMPLFNPDIIKLDRSIIQSGSDSWAVSQVVNAVLHDAHRNGTQILAEGIERPEHVAVARSLGATLGQGWLYGRPGPLPRNVRASELPLTRVKRRQASLNSPFGALLAKKAELIPLSSDLFAMLAAHIENQASRTTNPGILAVNLGDGDVDDEARIRLTYLSNRGIEVFVFGTRVPRSLGGRIRCVPLADNDPLARERTVLFVGTHYGSGVFARRRTAGPEDDSWEGGTCYDPDRVVEATLTLVQRLPTATGLSS